MLIKKLLCKWLGHCSWRRPRKGEAMGIKTCTRCGATAVMRQRKPKAAA